MANYRIKKGGDKMIKYWKKGNELHIQKGFEWGNDLTCVENGEMGTYIPLTDEEHMKKGYVEISFEEACEMVRINSFACLFLLRRSLGII